MSFFWLILFTAVNSASNSWHCSLMCGAYTCQLKKTSPFYLARAFSYILCGGLAGFFGLYLSLLVSASAFQLFLVTVFLISLVFTFYYTFIRPKKIKQISCGTKLKYAGLVLGLAPCPILFVNYGLAASTGSAAQGAILLFVHALFSTPALVAMPYFLKIVPPNWARFKTPFIVILFAITFINAIGYATTQLKTTDKATSHFLCK